MQALLGVLYHSIGGFASGSFYMPFNKVKGWAWESYWIVGGLFSWLIVPPLAAYLTVPGFFEIIFSSSQQIIYFTFLMGLLWGIGGLTYGFAPLLEPSFHQYIIISIRQPEKFLLPICWQVLVAESYCWVYWFV